VVLREVYLTGPASRMLDRRWRSWCITARLS